MTSTMPARVTSLAASISPLAEAFNAAQGVPRLLALVSPT